MPEHGTGGDGRHPAHGSAVGEPLGLHDAFARYRDLTDSCRYLTDSAEYLFDAWQRSVLYLDTMRRRSDQAREHATRMAPHVLRYNCELVMDGRELDAPVNYMLARIVPSDQRGVDPSRRPFVIVDPRAGHGPGIGGFKADSEIGVALKAGHPCYFVGFLPEPVPGQSIEDVVRAEALFLEEVIARHPEAEGKPCVIGNCQAGWAVLILAALRPELFGPIIVAGTPLSYWAGVHGQYPMRYAGGLLGGSWVTALASDLGQGKFDGAWLVQNFENQNPANTLWTKQYDLYSRIDTEVDRYLGFEKWWGGHVSLNAAEIQFIVDELFVGNKLASGDIRMRDGTVVDLRNIRSPIVVLCSKGDNITPPQQALDWLLDVFDDVEQLRAHGQTVVYTVHEKIGHLGIFVSGSVARKEHDEFTSNIDFIDVLPPGLYEAKFEPKGEAIDNPDLITGQWIMRCEERTLDDIRALGGNTPEDDRRFAAAARLSEINLAAYRTFVQPALRAGITPWFADALRRLHPLHLQYEMLASEGIAGPWIRAFADTVRHDRKKVASDNPWLLLQEEASSRIVSGLEAWRQMVEWAAESSFHAIYGTPLVQEALGIDRDTERPPRRAPKSLMAREVAAARMAQLRSRFSHGGLKEAVARALIYVGTARGGADERGFEAIRRLRRAHATQSSTTIADFKAVLRDQFDMLKLDQEAAVAAIADLLPKDRGAREDAFRAVEQVLQARGEVAGTAAERLARLARIFTAEPAAAGQPVSKAAPANPKPVSKAAPANPKNARKAGDVVIRRRSATHPNAEALDDTPPHVKRTGAAGKARP